MNIRLSILLIVCVVVPTSVLSLMAAISVRRWEAVAAARQEREAVSLVRAARSAADAGLRSALARVRERMAVSLAAGKTGEEMRAQAARAEADSPLVERVFVFMNPWGFVSPGEAPGGRGATNSPDMAALEAAVRRELAAVGRASWIPLQVGDQSYVFGALGEGGGLHVGFRVRQAAAIEAAMSAAPSGADLQVSMLRTADENARAAGDVVVSDPLGGTIRLGDEKDWSAAKGSGSVMAEGRLAPPLRHVAVRVLGTAAVEGREAASIRTQFQIWGIVLLGAAVLAGVGISLRAVLADLRRSRNQADLVLGVSHDLRTPVASIRALAESLSLGRVTDPEKKKRFMDSILREAERLTHLTERALYLLRFEQGAMALGQRCVALGPLVHEAVDLFLQRRGLVRDPSGECRATSRAGQAGVTVAWSLPDEEVFIEGDPSALLQVVSNVLDNAWQYAVGPRALRGGAGAAGPDSAAPGVGRAAPRGDSGEERSAASPPLLSGDASIGIRLEPARGGMRRGKGVRIVVEDNGIGLSPGECRRVFRRFYRTPAARQLHASGVGLGLAFCRYVVEEHGGSITVESEPGRRTRFSVWLPATAGETPGNVAVEGTSVRREEVSDGDASQQSSGGRL